LALGSNSITAGTGSVSISGVQAATARTAVTAAAQQQAR
jgi:hypothetical protein